MQTIINPRPVASLRPFELPNSSGFPATTAVTVWRTIEKLVLAERECDEAAQDYKEIGYRRGGAFTPGEQQVAFLVHLAADLRLKERVVLWNYEKALFERKLFELGLTSGFTRRIMDKYGERFSLDELRAHLEVEMTQSRLSDQDAIRGILMLARSNYEVQFQPQQPLSERILFPATPSQRNGIEDARFVRFQNDDRSYVYYATFTAFDGKVIFPELVETSDFLQFRFITLNGPAAKNKGMALFPRKINGLYAMLSRQDNENIYLMFSDNVHFWYESKALLKPMFPWELVQLGNCGSPIETEAGWLVLSHGVGPLRTYCIGAFLLDHDNPGKVIGRLRGGEQEPTFDPNRPLRQLCR